MKKQDYVLSIVKKAKQASYVVVDLSEKKKNALLNQMADALVEASASLVRANKKDCAYAKTNGLSVAMIDRLTLSYERIEKMASAMRDVATLPDPIGKPLAEWKRPNGLKLEKRCVPLGVIFIIYEARPNVTTECASLCLKTNNVVLLRGGKESIHSNTAVVKVLRSVLKKHALPQEIISFIDTTDRSVVDLLLKQNDYIDLVIPRGGEGLIRKVVALSTIPVIKHYKGICHVFIDQSATQRMAIDIAMNAKCQRPSVCNAMETLLVHEKVAQKFLPLFAKMFAAKNGVIYGCGKTRRILKGMAHVHPATLESYGTEYLDYALSVKVVGSVDEAITHINTFSSGHTDAIITNSKINAERFVHSVDSSSVMVNASTRFSDGNEYGFGAEIGISTDKIHARGPMGIEGLTSYKYCVRGTGQIRT